MPKSLVLLLLSLIGLLWWIRLDLPPLQRDTLRAKSSVKLLFFFRIPKTASEMMALLLQWLQGINHFRHVRLRSTVDRRLDSTEQMELLEEMVAAVESDGDGPIPTSFDRHVYFIDFESHPQFSHVQFNYFSSVRDPIDRIISQFYYTRATPSPGLKLPPNVSSTVSRPEDNYQTFEECVEAQNDQCVFISGRHYDLAIPYFCGQSPFCSELNNIEALNLAKKNVEKYFSTVGVLEHLNCTLKVAEKTLTPFFQDVQYFYFHELLEPKKNKNFKNPRRLREDVATILKRNLSTEYDFYEYCRARLLRQCESLLTE